MDVQNIKKDNDDIRYLFVCIDVFSRMLWVVPIKDKFHNTVIEAFKNIIESSGRQPIYINSDAGSEFVNKHFQSYLKTLGIKFFISYSQSKAAHVERVIRTLRARFGRYFEYYNTFRYIDVLQDFVSAYNNTVHSITKIKPIDVSVSNDWIVWKNAFAPEKLQTLRKTPKFRVSDVVRISSVKSPFEKEISGKFQREYFVVTKVNSDKNPFSYKLKAFDDNEPIKGIFYEPELTKIKFSKNQPENQLFDIEKIIQRRLIGEVPYVYVKFVGYPPARNRWILESEIKDKSQNG